MNENLATITVARDNETQDAGGGFVDGEPTEIYSGSARLIVRAVPSDDMRDEADTGISTMSTRFFRIERPVGYTSPAIEFLVQDVVSVSSGHDSGKQYRVTAVYEYFKSVQLEGYALH